MTSTEVPSRRASHRRTTQFGPVRVDYDDAVLAPRAWTLEQSRIAAELAPSVPDGPVLELCCGAGQIGLAVGAWTGRSLVQVDDDIRACAWAAHNARTNGIPSAIVCMPVERLFLEPAPLIVADPPYLDSRDAATEPHPGHAVDGGRDGLALVRATVRAAARLVLAHGVVVLQLGGERQARALDHDLAPEVGLRVVATHRFGRDRAVAVLRSVRAGPISAGA